MTSGDRAANSSLHEVKAEKARLRADALARRAALSLRERIAASEAICRAVLSLDLVSSAAVSAYLPIRGEVDLGPAIEALARAGHPVGLPVMVGEALVFRRHMPGAPVVPLGFGTFGPGPDAEEIVPDVLLIPLAAFDRQGGRIGYGRAFYDRTIARFAAIGHFPRLIGIAFSVQEVDRVPLEPHDRPLGTILTETEEIAVRPHPPRTRSPR